MRRSSKSFRGLGIAIVAAAVTVVFAAGPAPAKESLPYADPNVNGHIGFCDRNKHPITSGSIYDQPFIWTAVSSTKAPNGYARGKAVLAAYQPRKDVDPGLWSGNQLTAPSTFTNPRHPMAQATNADNPLVFFTQSHPPAWDGLIQLRFIFSAPNMPVHRIPYPATNIRVTGDRWSVVSGGTVRCDAGTATSVATRVLPESLLASPQPLEVAGAKPASDAKSADASKAGAESATGNRSTDGGFAGGLGSGAVGAGLLAVALLGAGSSGFYLWHRRRSAMRVQEMTSS